MKYLFIFFMSLVIGVSFTNIGFAMGFGIGPIMIAAAIGGVFLGLGVNRFWPNEEVA